MLLDKIAAHPVTLACTSFVLTALFLLPSDAIAFKLGSWAVTVY